MKKIEFIIAVAAIVLIEGCKEKKNTDDQITDSTSVTTPGFNDDVDFLKRYTEIIILRDSTGNNRVAVSPALQGRVMTSTAGGENGSSFGWINRNAFLSGDTSEHINVFGGEDRFWLGPEGGQFSIYFSKGAEFNLTNWHVPRLIDLEPFQVSARSSSEASFTKDAELNNYSGTIFKIGIERKVRVLDRNDINDRLGITSDLPVSVVGFETINTLINKGNQRWKKETGLLSVWILGMFNPSDSTTIIVPYQKTANGQIVNDTYFGKVPSDRLKINDKVIYFRGDGKYRSKIGLSPKGATEWLGSYDASQGVLTLVKYTKPNGVNGYVNSLWEIQKEPYKGDAINAYNDGPPTSGAAPLGPFYELESSSPAAALNPSESIIHIHSTYHIKGTPEQIDKIMLKILGVTSQDAANAFK